MKKIFLFLLFGSWLMHSFAQNNIQQLQYWIDDNFANAVIIQDCTQQFNITLPTTNLSVGKHLFHYRVKQSNHLWSVVNSQSFVTQSNAVAYEYWFDEAYAQRFYSTFPTSEKWQEIIDSISTNALQVGKHVLHYRIKDAKGLWSSALTSNWIKKGLLDKIEYWFDNDFANRTTEILPIPLAFYSMNDLLSNLNVSGTHHSIHMRTHQQNGTWSVVTSQNFKSQNQLVAYEYWFNDDYANKMVQAIVAEQQYVLEPLIDVTSSALGSNIVHIRFKDNNNWSSTTSANFCHNDGDSSLRLTVFLQGYYDGNGSMKPVLQLQGVGNDPLLVDSIDVTLYNTIAPFTAVASVKAPLKTNGIAACNFPSSIIGNFYIGVKHRNSIETWSAVPVYRGICPTVYNFSNAAQKAFGSNMVEVDANRWALYSGDINQDDNIDLGDVALLENSILNFDFGYQSTDISGDGNVDLSDNPIVESNVNQFVFSIKP
jgi:hypothetical protein